MRWPTTPTATLTSPTRTTAGTPSPTCRPCTRSWLTMVTAPSRFWLTEYGAPTSGVSGSVTLAVQAQSITEAFQWAEQYSWVGPLFAFDWEPSVYDNYGDFALFNSDGTPTEGGLAFEAAASAYAG